MSSFSLRDSSAAMEEVASKSVELPQQIMISSGLTIKIAPSCKRAGVETGVPCSSNLDLPSPNIKNSMESSPYNSPSLVSPSSSAFVLVLQSPYISPRAMTPKLQENQTPLTLPSPAVSLAGDVYIGFHGQNPNLVRFSKWLKSELELQGIACFVADRAKYSDSQSHEIADHEMRFFAQKKNLIPLFFHVGPAQIMGLLNYNFIDKECKEAMDGLTKCNEFRLEANEGNWRSCVTKTAGVLRTKLGRNGVAEKDGVVEGFDEIPFSRNRFFVGREKELSEEQVCSAHAIRGEATGQSEGLADEESDVVMTRGAGRYISLEMGKSKEPILEAWIEPVLGRNSFERCKYKKSKSLGSNVICINGVPGIGKTNLALEFAHMYSQRYKKVLWVGGEARYFGQHMLNLSLNLGLDAFKRIKKELFRDMPHLLIIDNLETEKDWWEGKDLHDLIPRNTGGSHVNITTTLSKVMNFDTVQLPPLPLSDAMVLIRGRREKDYTAGELEFLEKFDEKLGRLSYGSLMSNTEEQYWKKNNFLMKVLQFCFSILHQINGRRNLLSSRMLLASAKKMPAMGNRFKKWTKCVALTFGCCAILAPQTCKSEEDSAIILVRLGLARRANKQTGCWIQLHPIMQIFARTKEDLQAAEATIQGASAFLVFGFKSKPPLVQLKAIEMVLYVKRTTLPLAIQAFKTFLRCNLALELLKVCTNVLEEAEKSFVSWIQDWCHGSLCWKKKCQGNQRVDEYVWQDMTLLKATLLETRAKLLLRGGIFIRMVMLGHNHAQTLAAQETLAKLVRMRSKI
ncbi:hypothetical protein I3843_11G205400 [Carya illinoinensis]|nr:hypothetical protein I3843_11G205400 [Carya illinoinensis]